MWFQSTSQLDRFSSLEISQFLAGSYLKAPPGEDYEQMSTVVQMRPFALCFAVDGDESRSDVVVVPSDWNTRTQTTAYERVLRESAGRVADEREQAADAARFEREQARERRLVAEQNRVTFVPHAPTLVDNGDAEALRAQQKAAVEASRSGIPPDFLKFLPLP